MFSNDLFLCFCVVIMNGMDRMDGMDSDEELFSQEILQPNFSIDSILDAIEDMSLLHKIRVRKNERN